MAAATQSQLAAVQQLQARTEEEPMLGEQLKMVQQRLERGSPSGLVPVSSRITDIQPAIAEKSDSISEATSKTFGNQLNDSNSNQAQSLARQRKHRRMANQITKDFKCMYCEKFYGSSAAAIMHMRKKHKEGTKQEIERRSGIRVNEILKKNIQRWKIIKSLR